MNHAISMYEKIHKWSANQLLKLRACLLDVEATSISRYVLVFSHDCLQLPDQ